MSPAVRRSSENMLVRPNSDGTYSATWTPASTGWYSVIVTVDGYALDEVKSHSNRKFFLVKKKKYIYIYIYITS
jgi:hypothetical protein